MSPGAGDRRSPRRAPGPLQRRAIVRSCAAFSAHIIAGKWRQAPDTAAVQAAAAPCECAAPFCAHQNPHRDTPTARRALGNRAQTAPEVSLHSAASRPPPEKTSPLSPLPPSPGHISHPKGKLHYINHPAHCIFNRSHSY